MSKTKNKTASPESAADHTPETETPVSAILSADKRIVEPEDHPLITERIRLKAGAHVILIAQNKGGQGKTIGAIEVTMACLIYKIPFVLATLDQSNDTLTLIFGRRKPKQSKSQKPEFAEGSTAESTEDSTDEAREDDFQIVKLDISDLNQREIIELLDLSEREGAVIIIDTPPAYADERNPMIAALKRSRVFDGEASIAAYMPVTPDTDSIQGAFTALKVMPVKFARGIIRAWRSSPHDPPWDSFSHWNELLEITEFKIWETGDWTPDCKKLIYRTGEFAEFPPLDLLDGFFQTPDTFLPRAQRKPVEEALAYFAQSSEVIYQHLLEPIIEK